MSGQPTVSIVTPTYNRRNFIPWLIKCIRAQEYPKDKLEWVILDDGTDKIGDLVRDIRDFRVKYIPVDEKMNIGAKRNRLNDESSGQIIICMDDDDYYCPTRVSHAVKHLMGDRQKRQIAGSSEIYMYYADSKKIYKLGPYGPNHATNGTFAYKREYSAAHRYEEHLTHAEETSFLNNYTSPMIQLDPMQVILVMSHHENTFDKRGMRDTRNDFMKETKLKIKDFIRDAKLREFYSECRLSPTTPNTTENSSATSKKSKKNTGGAASAGITTSNTATPPNPPPNNTISPQKLDETIEKSPEKTEKPDETSHDNIEITEKPDETSQKPDETIENSLETSQKPHETIENSLETSQKPDEIIEITEKSPENTENLDETMEKLDEIVEKLCKFAEKRPEIAHKLVEIMKKLGKISEKIVEMGDETRVEIEINELSDVDMIVGSETLTE